MLFLLLILILENYISLDSYEDLNTEVEILEDNTEEIEELSYEWTTNEIADRVDKLIKAVNQIRKDLNKWSARIVPSNFYVTEKNVNF